VAVAELACSLNKADVPRRNDREVALSPFAGLI
jgi:hypothetical protein